MTGTAAAQMESDDSENSSVDVTVGSTIAVDVQPANLDYNSASVGDRSTSSNRGFGAIEIENTGSEFINRIWLNTSVPNSDPFGTGDANDYDAGNFIEVQPQDGLDAGPDWQFINRKEFMYTTNAGNVPSFIQVPNSWTSDGYAVAPIRRGNETIYTAIDSSSGTCDGTGADTSILVGNVSSTDTRLGTVDFTDSSEYGYANYSIAEASGNSYGIAQPNPGYSGASGVALNWTYSSDVLEYDFLTKCSGASEPANLVRTRYNPTAEGADNIQSNKGNVADYLLQTTSDTSVMLAPGELATVQTAINVPQGVAQGSVDPGTLRVLITADTDAVTDE